ncbi:ATP-dependent Clp protease ATP-binding subunit [Listeria cossartiae subsp. cayugensis]|uniref:ATP-dependent Clp protease ATP-binding subunit n=1 Tax=Listeria cossartiae subsp. cayugensis TaxID=2713505 RepID=A0ABU2ILK7_9LIST|nr:ATP-dependent Clp protease ATP-binding subunit [Listeria cossartiae]MDT0048778.1 ATP-dependent Clp protease ATP-binding subunit [Listeria cossartiae subsp. cayugensis]MDT0065281.1 ATP-dependent Clp protease ATP-binding subunit [Listeria cossartiae subsp. cayugensis]MDT0079115.1 ATP-dependent Clp protease ATP-binding subunit [Listeria cossartiae subsp. cayugensis]MDT0081951.1 ATP-dependent Clp protease ATP-binding subunit [Listeria cossartiae subsp. cayugensis]MDT0087514.1 ATP-dependent Clp 
MNCEKCNQNQATIQLYMNINGKRVEMPLCASCYAEVRNQANFGANEFLGAGGSPFDDIFRQLSGAAANQANREQRSQANPQVQTQTSGGGNGLLDEFGTNLTDMAKNDQLDPVIGRDKEIKRVIEILNRRNKNNPVLIGEPGVGKTAVVEGLANAIVAGNVPSKLINKEVILLDVASLVSGTGIRGQFEERMKQLIKELQERKNTILFIDEVHTIVGAGSAEGSMDAGNILKPALARGDLQMIGATTLKEYRTIEKDAALERRFQPVTVNEPSTKETLTILNGLKQKYEDFHEVVYSPEALTAAVELSSRYIQDRHLPDKAIDLMDEVGSKYNLSIEKLDENTVSERVARLEEEKNQALQMEDYEKAAKVRDEITRLEENKTSNSFSERPVIQASDIQAIIEEKTGIPVGRLQEDEQSKMKNLESNLTGKVIGQEDAVKKVAKAIRRSRVGLKSKNRPIGSFLFVGPTGVGKTELGRTLARELFGTSEAMIRLDMSEFMEKHSVSKLIGSPPGYVGHEEAGQLTEKVRRNPYSIILLDEIEKAHPDVQHMFLQILEDGRLTDSQGRTVSFKDTVIIMTSNAGATDTEAYVGFNTTADTKLEKGSDILAKLGAYFKPEFLNRLDSVIEFKSLEKDDLVQIIDLMLVDLNAMLAQEGVTIDVSKEVKEQLIELGYDPKFGARPLRRTIQEHLEDAIADSLIDQPEAKNLTATLNEDKEIIITEQVTA